ncbi:MAG TPA: large-conductance mechanosensitive channel protein MscL [Candidatus Saccharimonadales bacterium]|nr:large-conductance mechanosensitive channel protein MscL [Candidatus Saccharimonadales bacterium]
MNKYFKEFKAFAVKGNVMDLAVAVIIGGAFGKIVSSLVSDVVMPIIGVIVGGLNFTSFKIILKKAILDGSGVISSPAVTMNIGNFIQNIFDFLIIALSIFFMIKLLGKVKSRLVKEEEEKKEAKPAPITKDQELLAEIRDLLKGKQD